MNYIWELIINILESSIFFLLLNGKLNQKIIEHIYVKQTLALLLQAIILFILNISNAPQILTILSIISIYYVYSCIFFDSPHIVSMFWVIVYTIAEVASDALTTIIPTKLLHINLEALLTGGRLRIPFTLVYITLLTIIVVILLCFSSQTFRLNTPDKIIFIFLSLMCISIEELIVVSQASLYINESKNHANVLYIIFFLVMFLFIGFVFYVYNLGIEKEKNIQLTEIQIQSEMEKKQYEDIISSISQLRYMKHDINNHLGAISSMITNKKYSEVNDYIKDLTESINTTYYILTSGNTAVDSIITNKLNQCREAHITVNYTIHLPSRIPIPDFELCSLLGNLFDNAIEACKKLDDKDEKIIDFCIRPYKKMLSFTIYNKTNGNYLQDESNQLLSTKKDKEIREHGIGLKRVKYIVEAHGGIMDISPGQTEFKVSILIPLDSEAE